MRILSFSHLYKLLFQSLYFGMLYNYQNSKRNAIPTQTNTRYKKAKATILAAVLNEYAHG